MGSQDWGMGFLALFALTDHRMNERLKRNDKGRGEAVGRGRGSWKAGGGGGSSGVCDVYPTARSEGPNFQFHQPKRSSLQAIFLNLPICISMVHSMCVGSGTTVLITPASPELPHTTHQHSGVGRSFGCHWLRLAFGPGLLCASCVSAFVFTAQTFLLTNSVFFRNKGL